MLALGHNPKPASPGEMGNATQPEGASAQNASTQGSSCLHNQPVIREDLDVVSVRFRVINEPSVPVQSEFPTLLLFNLNTGVDSGGTLMLNLLSLRQIFLMTWDVHISCSTRLFWPSNGTALRPCVSAGGTCCLFRLTFWYLPSQHSECDKAKAKVTVSAYLSPCFDDCGTYGQCSLLRRHGYLYAGCSCKAGWGGWSCTDNTKAQSVGTQTLATLLLTLSNLLFLPAIAIAVYRYYLVEASVYIYTMFFSTFYHACDQPGVAVMCIMDYDTLQYCDFLGSVVSIWVTILCMSRVKKILKYVLFVLGILIIAMSLQLDRKGIWNMMGPCLFALVILATAWVVKRCHCYPSSWKRWVFYLLPGITLAFVAIAVYAFMETNDNYYYTHRIWHILVATSVAFLLPPQDKHKKPWAWPQKLICRYQICQNDREELYGDGSLGTGPGGHVCMSPCPP
uniref:Post-GPI attachment to proteins 6 n=1 Tax=Sphenodon punctatus TaxID=8508 RepID=A0A8D0LBM9_SPHPU